MTTTNGRALSRQSIRRSAGRCVHQRWTTLERMGDEDDGAYDAWLIGADDGAEASGPSSWNDGYEGNGGGVGCGNTTSSGNIPLPPPPPPPPSPQRVPPPPPSRFPQSGINPGGGGGAATTTTVSLGVYFIRLSVILMRYIIRKATKKKKKDSKYPPFIDWCSHWPH
jgi:hypothetical protein